MATKPTRLQERACDRLAEALGSIAEAARLDGKATLTGADLREIALKMVRATSAFSLDDILNRALERRGKGLGLRPGTTELLLLFDAGMPPIEMLRISDDAFREVVARLDEELGEP